MPKTARKSASALLVLDMLSEFEFPDAMPQLRAARRIAVAVARLKARAQAAAVPVIYVNDTAGHWESDRRSFIERCLAGKGGDVVEQLLPDERDYFMFKPRHSAFYGTPLAEILYAIGAEHLVIAGMSSHQCVLLTASDAHVRNLAVTVITDCIASAKKVETRHATYILEHGLDVRLRQSQHFRFARRGY